MEILSRCIQVLMSLKFKCDTRGRGLYVVGKESLAPLGGTGEGFKKGWSLSLGRWFLLGRLRAG